LQFLGIVLRTVITIGSTAVLARLLTPADFGYIVMATVVTELVFLFSNFGLSNLLIQRRRITRLQVDTVFWASALLGVALGMVVFLASFFVGWLFPDPQVGELLRVLCVTFALGGLTAIPSVVLLRLMHFQAEFWIQIVTIITRTAGAIAFAYAGFGMWSLVAGTLMGAVIQSVLGFLAVPYLPRLRFHAQLLTSTWKTSGGYFGSGLLFYANMNVDLMLIGRSLGATSLGYYQNARGLTDEIRSRIAIPLQHVLFPALSAVQSERERIQALVIRGGRLLAAIVVPTGVGLSATAEDLVPVLYGPQWLPMIPVLSVFGLVAAIKASTAITAPLFNACNRVGLAFKYNLLNTTMTITAVWFAVPHGIEAVAWAMLLVAPFSVVAFRAALGLIGLDLSHVWHILGSPALASAAMWVGIAAGREITYELTSNPSALLALHVVLGALTYSMVLHLLSRRYATDFRDVLVRLRTR
jgi:PST family polysaccharide transporter